MTMAWYNPTSTSASSYSTIYIHSSTSSTTSTVWSDTGTSLSIADSRPPLQTHLLKGQRVHLPDGSELLIDHQGNFKILDDDAKITYLGNRIREFNKYINASDLLEEFIRDLGSFGVRQGDVLGVPVEFFINWLIHKAAQQDGDPPPEDLVFVPTQKEDVPMLETFTPESLRDAGIARVISNTDPRFSILYDAAFETIVKRGVPFIGEDVTLEFKSHMLDFMASFSSPIQKKPSSKYYGAKFNGKIQKLLKDGTVTIISLRKTKTLASHARRTPLYAFTRKSVAPCEVAEPAPSVAES